ncbi:MAG: lipid-A-disaccharide synthase [Chlorobi bacterium]|nr:lipid-A-disaccharide synthase [Chlorobiota bacterium]
MSLRVLIIAGDRSGDIHAARLMSAIRTREPATEFVGIGGPAMAAVGLRSIVPFDVVTVNGFWEVVRHYRSLRAAFDRTCQFIAEWKYDVFIPVDYPGFNLPLAQRIRAKGIPVLWYIAPQLWAWGKWRAERLAASVDRLFVVLPFEVDFFRRYGIAAEFHGHPLLDNPQYSQAPQQQKQLNLIALLPGLRQAEQERHLPLMLRLVEQLCTERPHLGFAVACEKPNLLRVPDDVQFMPDVESLLRQARYAVVKAGTSTLETLLAGTTQVVVYRASLVTYLVGQAVMRIPFVALPNILAGECIVPEVVQWSDETKRLQNAVEDMLDDPLHAEQQLRLSEHIRQLLGGSGASARIADRMLELLGRQ